MRRCDAHRGVSSGSLPCCSHRPDTQLHRSSKAPSLASGTESRCRSGSKSPRPRASPAVVGPWSVQEPEDLAPAFQGCQGASLVPWTRASGQAAALPAEPEGQLRAGTVGAGGEREGIGGHKVEGRLTVNSKENLPSNDRNLSSSKSHLPCVLCGPVSRLPWLRPPGSPSPGSGSFLLEVSFAAGSCAGAGVTLHCGRPGRWWPERA